MGPRSEDAKEKQRLRQSLRERRRTLSADSLEIAARNLMDRGLAAPELQGARQVAGYVANDGELDVAPLLAALAEGGAQILLPRCRADGSLDLVISPPGSALEPSGPGGLLEPPGLAVALTELHPGGILLAPAVALDRSGRRLGRGGGAYDRFLPQICERNWAIWGVCHEEAVLSRVPSAAHDIAVDAILTESDARTTGARVTP